MTDRRTLLAAAIIGQILCMNRWTAPVQAQSVQAQPVQAQSVQAQSSDQSETSSWFARQATPPRTARRGAKLLKIAPFQPPGKVIVPPAGKGGVVTTRSPAPTLPTLPSELPAGDTTIAKTSPSYDPAYEAFDLGHYKQALALATIAAERGEPQAATLVGRIYQEGDGVKRDDVVAAQWYRRAAEAGDTNAMFAFGVMLAEGGAIKQDRLGAAQMFEKAASKGHVVANYNLGQMFLTGDGKPLNQRRAFAHLQYAAEQGLATAAFDLGTMYSSGTGVDANAFEAARWFKRAADADLVEAQLAYGVVLFQGKGMPVDEKGAAEMFRRAAEKGNPVAQSFYARCLAKGRGAPANLVAAVTWSLISKSAGPDRGVDDPELDKIAARLSKADLLKARAAAALWRDQVALQ